MTIHHSQQVYKESLYPNETLLSLSSLMYWGRLITYSNFIPLVLQPQVLLQPSGFSIYSNQRNKTLITDIGGKNR